MVGAVSPGEGEGDVGDGAAVERFIAVNESGGSGGDAIAKRQRKEGEADNWCDEERLNESERERHLGTGRVGMQVREEGGDGILVKGCRDPPGCWCVCVCGWGAAGGGRLLLFYPRVVLEWLIEGFKKVEGGRRKAEGGRRGGAVFG